MNVNVNFTTRKQSVPAAIPVSGNIRVDLMRGDTLQATGTVALPSTGTVFGGVPDGTYTVKAQRLDTNGQPVGDASTSDPIEVVHMTEIDVPDTVTVTL